MKLEKMALQKINPGLLQVSDKSTISDEQLGYILLSMSWHTGDVMVLEALSC